MIYEYNSRYKETLRLKFQWALIKSAAQLIGHKIITLVAKSEYKSEKCRFVWNIIGINKIVTKLHANLEKMSYHKSYHWTATLISSQCLIGSKLQNGRGWCCLTVGLRFILLKHKIGYTLMMMEARYNSSSKNSHMSRWERSKYCKDWITLSLDWPLMS